MLKTERICSAIFYRIVFQCCAHCNLPGRGTYALGSVLFHISMFCYEYFISIALEHLPAEPNSVVKTGFQEIYAAFLFVPESVWPGKMGTPGALNQTGTGLQIDGEISNRDTNPETL